MKHIIMEPKGNDRLEAVMNPHPPASPVLCARRAAELRLALGAWRRAHGCARVVAAGSAAHRCKPCSSGQCAGAGSFVVCAECWMFLNDGVCARVHACVRVCVCARVLCRRRPTK